MEDAPTTELAPAQGADPDADPDAAQAVAAAGAPTTQLAAAEDAIAAAASPPAPAGRGAPAGDPPAVPAFWLRWKGPRHYGHIPTTGSGVGGELTPAEVQAWFTPALYAQALQDGIYEVVDAGTVRDPRPAAQKEAPDAR